MSMPQRRAFARAVTVLSLLGAAPLAAQQINTGTPPPNVSWPKFSFGRALSGGYGSLGQSFTMDPGLPTRLDGFTFWVADVADFATLPFHAYLFPFDPTTREITGAYLFRSPLLTGSTGGPTALAFSTGGLDLTTGQTYLALLSSAEVPGAPLRAFGGIFESTGGVTSTYPGGTALARNSLAADGLAGLSAGPWGAAGGTTADLAFTATFSDAAVVVTPEPVTIALVGAGLVGAAAVARRRRAG